MNVEDLVDIIINRLKPQNAEELETMIATDPPAYYQYFTPFAFDAETLRKILQNAQYDRYWGIWHKEQITGFFMLRGFDEGYERPTLGIYISQSYAGKSLSQLAFAYTISWCKLNGISSMMLKVHPDNHHSYTVCLKFGFKQIGIDSQNDNIVMEKQLR